MNHFLSIVWYRVLPPQYGGQKGIALFNHFLAAKVDLTCLCSQDNLPGENTGYKVLNDLPVSRFQFWNPFTRKKILSFIKQSSFTHIIIEHPYHAWLGRYKKRLGFKFIVHAHNIEHLRMKARGKTWWHLIRKTEERAFERADHILFKTEADRDRAIDLFDIEPGVCIIVPYGICESAQPFVGHETKSNIRERHNILNDKKIILFAGTLDYEPNSRALELIAKQILPLLRKRDFHFQLVICGDPVNKDLFGLERIPDVTLAGFVPSIEDYFQSADVFINPIVNGSGVQTKNMEAIAAGCNVVTTAFAASGLPHYLKGKKAFISRDDDWEEFVNNIILASSRPAIVPERFYEEYNWKHIIDRFLMIIDY